MFLEQKPLTVRNTCSYLCNNLDILEHDEEHTTTFTFVHLSIVEVEHLSMQHSHSIIASWMSEGVPDNTVNITQAKWCSSSEDKIVLVLTSNIGFQIFDRTGSKELMTHHFVGESTEADATFCKGISYNQKKIYIGTSEGGVIVVEQLSEILDLKNPLQTSAITDLCCGGEGHMVAADEAGLMVVWTPEHHEYIAFGRKGVPCLSVKIYKDLLIGGFASGHLKIYSISKSTFLIDIAAHAQSVMTMDVTVPENLLLSASEDGTVAVWQLPKETDSKVLISNVFSCGVSDKQLCGGHFYEKGTKFAVTAYDWNEIIPFKKISQAELE